MINALFNAIIKVIEFVLSPFVAILDGIITPLFPNLGSNVSNFINIINDIADYMTYPLTVLPVEFIKCLIAIVQIEFLWITGQIAYHGAIKIFRIIKNIKFW